NNSYFALCQKYAFVVFQINEIYINEYQDNQIEDIALILKVFNNANGIFLASDIAQYIVHSSSFRFQNKQEIHLTNYIEFVVRQITIVHDDEAMEQVTDLIEDAEMVYNNKKGCKEITLFAKESSSKEWDEEREKFLDKIISDNENKKLHDLADAYHFQQIARDSISYLDNVTKKDNFTYTAQAFKTCSKTFLEAFSYVQEKIKKVKELQSHEKFEEAINMFINTIKNYDTFTESL
ncbi:30933_t:CDS:2, partial [Gigaspora margarita]